jgi:hypothetical protein
MVSAALPFSLQRLVGRHARFSRDVCESNTIELISAHRIRFRAIVLGAVFGSAAIVIEQESAFYEEGRELRRIEAECPTLARRL